MSNNYFIKDEVIFCMNDYIIEGTITELSSNSDECIFKIRGCEGYSVSLDKKKYNVLYSEDVKTKKDEKAVAAFVLFSDRDFKLLGKQECLLATALAYGKKVRVVINATEDEIKTGVGVLLVTCVTLLTD